MKKVIALTLALILCLSLCACGGGNIEKFCGGSSITWDGYEGQNNDSVCYNALFEDGVLTIEKRVVEVSSSSPTGKLWPVEETDTYSYELQGKDTVIIDGKTYTYSISGDRVNFNMDLMGIDSWWKR